MKAVKIKVIGDVQGVSFRYWAQRAAKKCEVVGWAKNEHDGSVTILAQGVPQGIECMIAWAKEGSPMSTIEGVEVEETEATEGLKGFVIK